jgi:hypothetical protein
MMIIDDEADNASINIKKGNDEVSKINGQIRQILDVFDRSCYVGYTATPFANIFIDPDSDDEMYGADLFPRDFIVSLDPPDNYFGASRIFMNGPNGESDGSVIRYIEDNEDLLPLRHTKDFVITGLPESLKKAVRTFIVGRAIRLARGHEGQHNSMLVNASRFTDIQRQLRNEIHVLVDDIRSSVRVNGNKPVVEALRDPELNSLHKTFCDEFNKHCKIDWADIQSRLHESVSPVNVVEVNSRSSGSLDYAEHSRSGLNVIAVGGFSLSRGLTLEGLMVSYFLRNSMMYDTLMQMGRWFGYRPGYDDLCRVWMLEEAEGWYTHIAESIEELRDELRRMEAANATPREFGLRVRSHPDTLIVTARNKMGSSERHVVSVGLGNQFVETAILRRDKDSLTANRKAARNLIDASRIAGFPPEEGEPASGGRLLKSVPASMILDFLAAFQNHSGSLLTETAPVRRYIEERVPGELDHWDMLIPGIRNRSEKSLVFDDFGFDLVCQRRYAGKRSDQDKTLVIGDKLRVSSRGVEKAGLSPEEIAAAERAYCHETDPPRDPTKVNYPDRIYRRRRRRPLFILHMLAIGREDDDLHEQEPVVAWSISFPKTEYEEKKVEYVVNTTWFRERYEEEADEDEAAGDDD